MTASIGPVDHEYWQRKNRELAFMRAAAGQPPAGAAVADVDGLFAAARDLRRAIRVQQAAASAHLLETSLLGAHDYQAAFGEVSYSYQRYDLTATSIDWLAELHGLKSGTRAVRGMFLSSGMAAVAAALAVISARRLRRIAITPMAYYETHLLQQRFFTQLELLAADAGPAEEADVWWLDTSSTRWGPPPKRRGSLRLMVVDTSCVDAASDSFGQWIDDAARLGIPLLLLRSHVKLDSFGLELARLGSSILVGPDGSLEAIESWATELRDARAGLGLGFELSHVYPWFGAPDFFRFASSRVKGIQSATEAMADAIEAARAAGDGYDVITLPHQLFCLVRTGITFADHAAATRGELSELIGRRWAAARLPGLSGDSFGLDRFVVVDFVNMHDGLHYLRVSPADLPLAYVEPMGRHVRDAIAQMLGRS